MRYMMYYTIPTDGDPHQFKLSGNPVAVKALNSFLAFWAEYTEDDPQIARTFQAFRTSEPLPENAQWVGTCDWPHKGQVVWHLYEIK